MSRASQWRLERRGNRLVSRGRRPCVTFADNEVFPPVMRLDPREFEQRTGARPRCAACGCDILSEVVLTTKPPGVWCTNCHKPEGTQP